jgi:cyclopropane fatty-acyl-phospholipid synthase-like methyltransferase
MARTAAAPRATYGIESPYLLVIPALLIVSSVLQGVLTRQVWPFLGALLIVAALACGYHAARRGKFVVWSRLLDGLGLRGDERILDIGCGRGPVLLLAARRLTTGRATGVDLWRGRDQSGNAMEATRRNARAEGLGDRVELCTADMTALPFEDAGFDVVLSSSAVHNVAGRAGRDAAIAEAVRVLRPGGRLLIADLFGTRRYRARLTALGMLNVTRRNLGWRMWWSGPWLPSRLVSATRPPRA